jgi:hypothetical protein
MQVPMRENRLSRLDSLSPAIIASLSRKFAQQRSKRRDREEFAENTEKTDLKYLQTLRAASRPPSLRIVSGLRRLYILGLPAFGSFDHVELDLLTFLQAAESICLDG